MSEFKTPDEGRELDIVANSLRIIENWVNLDLAEMANEDRFQTFYGYAEQLIGIMGNTGRFDLTELKQQFKTQFAELNGLVESGLSVDENAKQVPIVMLRFQTLGLQLLGALADGLAYDFKCFGDKNEGLLKPIVENLEILVTVPEEEMSPENYLELLNQTGLLLQMMCNGSQLINLNYEEMERYTTELITIERQLSQSTPIEEKYPNLAWLTQLLLHRIKITQKELDEIEKQREQDGYDDLSFGGTFGQVMEGLAESLQKVLKSVPSLGKKKVQIEEDDKSTVDTCTSNIKEWMETDIEEMWKEEPFIAFCTNTEMLISTLEQKGGMDLEAINQKFNEKKAELIELLDLQSRGLETELPDEELMYKPTMRQVLVEQPYLIQPKIYYVMQELRALAEKLLDRIEGNEREQVFDFEFFGAGIPAEDFERIIGRIQGFAGYPRESINRHVHEDLEGWVDNLFIRIRDRIWNSKELKRFLKEKVAANDAGTYQASFEIYLEAADKMIDLFRVSEEELARREAERTRLATDQSPDK